jgi:hypothetical protein
MCLRLASPAPISDPTFPDSTSLSTARSSELVAPLSALKKKNRPKPPCYDAIMFNFGKPKTAGDWFVHIAGAIVAIFLVWWMLRLYVL